MLKDIKRRCKGHHEVEKWFLLTRVDFNKLHNTWLSVLGYCSILICVIYGYTSRFNTIARVVLTAWLTSMDIDVFIHRNNAMIGLIRVLKFMASIYLTQKTQCAW